MNHRFRRFREGEASQRPISEFGVIAPNPAGVHNTLYARRENDQVIPVAGLKAWPKPGSAPPFTAGTGIHPVNSSTFVGKPTTIRERRRKTIRYRVSGFSMTGVR
jgi:hypothetical protein